jgi:hypothetical protein
MAFVSISHSHINEFHSHLHSKLIWAIIVAFLTYFACYVIYAMSRIIKKNKETKPNWLFCIKIPGLPGLHAMVFRSLKVYYFKLSGSGDIF